MSAQSKNLLKRYGDVIALWIARYDTAEISHLLAVPEHTVARWIANFRDLAMEQRA
ncbi:hypothetical protein DYI24_20905 [Rhodopseudomonas sp. BR0C11]|uniref:hypothetical protein n=1 Tax=Rhodopseudomonas sp. BR0C11 TaxID=2269370 RepID=UPI0013E02203|nr:hypothetical protein [Rhodopseudomonas sp. BR0C11]NEV79499.1 hypothetical protein [Rhodopseudomonas sp. BR0C11]